jgi:hypothetical protein
MSAYKFVASSRFHEKKQSDFPVVAVWEGFTENTTAHGIPHIKNARGEFYNINDLFVLISMFKYNLFDTFSST